jgi:catechol 2,3-dioxygenase-like lactoylglutathione lyase family enzyme
VAEPCGRDQGFGLRRLDAPLARRDTGSTGRHRSMSLTSLYHVGLTVSNLERSMAFYQDAVGMAVEYSADLSSDSFDKLIAIKGIGIKFCYLTLGGFRLQLIEYVSGGDEAHLELRHNKVGNPHISLWVDDVESQYAKLQALDGVNITSEIILQKSDDIAARTFYVTDPDGVQVEFCQKIYDHASR